MVRSPAGMAHLPVHRIWSLICTQIESDSGWTGYYTRLLPLEALYGWTALGGRLRIGNTFGVPKNPVSYFLMEELLILGSRLVNMLIFLVVVKIKPQVCSATTCCATSSGQQTESAI